MKKFFRTALLVCALVLMMSGVARANNHSDSSFKFQMSGSNYQCTALRQKQDASSVYCYLRHIDAGKMRVIVRHSGGRNVTQGTYIIPKGQKRKIHNLAYETYGVCRIRLCGRQAYDLGRVVYSNGLWSPDSV